MDGRKIVNKEGGKSRDSGEKQLSVDEDHSQTRRELNGQTIDRKADN